MARSAPRRWAVRPPGNANLRNSGPATVILNEVTKQNRSALEGPVEVFGGPADVIIANPAAVSSTRRMRR
ncbi:hypothetical protein BLM14_21970 (plasmid) [Phyllobacterium zundukense]|nr:hypothetical protein BLM14_21970 [Phyllobacterium zundukense]